MEYRTYILEPIDKIEKYARAFYEFLRNKTFTKAVSMVSSAMFYVFASVAVAVFVTILNIGAAFWIGEKLGKTYYGFICVTGFYIIASVAAYLIHDSKKDKELI